MDMIPQRQAERKDIFSLLLRLHPKESGMVSPSSGPQVQAAFLHLVRTEDPTLADWLHTPNQRRPYTISLLQGFQRVPESKLADAMANNEPLPVRPEHAYWLRITSLDAAVFRSFANRLALHPGAGELRIGTVDFKISRLITFPEANNPLTAWAAYSSFEDVYTLQSAQKYYTFEFASPTAFSKGTTAWGKRLHIFPEPSLVFESLAQQWECFAPTQLRLTQQNLNPQEISRWCEEQIIISRYALETRYLASSRFGQVGFQGQVTYEVKGNPAAPVARWLTTLARLAVFSGIGYKTTMGMGQVRCATVPLSPSSPSIEGSTSYAPST